MSDNKGMSTDEMRQAMIEISLGAKPSDLKKKYPKDYTRLKKEITAAIRAGYMIEIPGDFF